MDQVDYVLYLLKNDSASRRILTNLFVHEDLKDMNLDYGIVYQDDLDNDTVNKLVEDIKTNNIKEIDELVGRNRGFLNRKTIYKVVR